MDRCDICGGSENILGCGASSIGPASFMMCQTCIEHNAEPSFAFAYVAEEVGEDVADFVNDLTTYIDGKYISYSEYLTSYYKRNLDHE